MPYILPDPAPAPLDDDALDDALQQAVVGITGMAGQWVRPRWQPEPPNQPDYLQDWCAIGATGFEEWGYPYEKQLSETKRQVERDQRFTVLASFYGPNAGRNLGVFRDGIMVEDNRAALAALGIKLEEVQKTRNVPALMKERWVPRRDVPVVFVRRIVRVYTLNSIDGAWLGLDNEHYITPIVVDPPPTP